ncbi:MAG: hypothetical protein N2255_08680 [Kiritimatiellae bacterium]|nr:hypothetical protein [Kiritimatiellia bacterium]
MQLPEGWESKSIEQIEAWFLSALESGEGKLDDFLRVLRHVSTLDVGQAEQWAGLLQDSLVERQDRSGLIQLLSARCTWRNDKVSLREECLRVLSPVFKDGQWSVLLKSCGLDLAGVPVQEALRRLSVLLALAPGVPCLDRTWGFGIVRGVDSFYGRVTVDFEKKAGHSMSLAYAAETLQLLPEEHLLVLWHRNPEGVRDLVTSNPAEVVRIALRSCGEMTIGQLQEMLVGRILKPEEWKPFWEEARKMLKGDALIHIPAKRSEPMRLLHRPKTYDESWCAELAAERDVDRIMELVGELVRNGTTRAIGPEARKVLVERLGYSLRGAMPARPEVAARVILLAHEAGVSDDELGGASVRTALLNAPVFLAAVERLSAREVEKLLTLLAESDYDVLARALLGLLNRLPSHAVEACVELLTTRGRGAEVEENVASLLRAREASPALLLYVCRHLGPVQDARWVQMSEFLAQVVECLEKSLTHDRRKAQKQIMALFEEEQWVREIMSALDDTQRRTLIKRIHNAGGWEASSRRSALAKMIKLYPDLASVLREESAPEVAPRPRRRLTSWRSYRARQEQLRKLVEVDIPRNSREIAHARSYGDLSENYEYKAAKEH